MREDNKIVHFALHITIKKEISLTNIKSPLSDRWFPDFQIIKIHIHI